MNFDMWAYKTFLTIDEAVDYLSAKSGESQDLMNPTRILGADVLRFALDGKLRLVVDVPTGTEDGESRPIEAGLWDLVMEGERGTPGRQQVEHDHLPEIKLDGVEGAWIARDGAQRQLEPIANWPSAIGAGCVLGARREALDALLEKMPAKDLDRPLKEPERSTLLVIIAALAKKAKMDIETHLTQASESIEKETVKLNARVPSSTVRRHLKAIPDAIENQQSKSPDATKKQQSKSR